MAKKKVDKFMVEANKKKKEEAKDKLRYPTSVEIEEVKEGKGVRPDKDLMENAEAIISDKQEIDDIDSRTEEDTSIEDKVEPTKQDKPETGSMSDGLRDALMYLGPRLGGLLIGGYEGYQEADKLATGFQKYQAGQKSLKGESPGQIDITPDFHTKIGQIPVFSRREGNKVVWFDDKGNIYSGAEIENIRGYHGRERSKDVTGRLGQNLSFGERKMVEANKETFLSKRLNKEMENLTQIENLQDLIDSGTRLTGLIDFKMAKGIAMEVGNLTKDERKAASQIVGFVGKWVDFREWVQSDLSEVRKEEIQKLIDFITPSLKKRMKRKTFLHARSAARRLKVNAEDYTHEILDASGFYYKEGPEQPQQKQQKSGKLTPEEMAELKELRAGSDKGEF